MYDADVEVINSGKTHRYRLRCGDRRLSYRDVITLWCSDEAFREFFNCLLAECPFAAFRWETPVVSSAISVRDFEFVSVNYPALERRVDGTPFADRLRNVGTASVVTFENLGGDAILVVPNGIGSESAYGHLASFVRDAPRPQQQAFWQAVGEAMRTALNQRPVWLSTAGMGVAWVHVRLDSRPKYYAHAAYRNEQSPDVRRR